jgi:hypothetical protein
MRREMMPGIEERRRNQRSTAQRFSSTVFTLNPKKMSGLAVDPAGPDVIT